jgi:hypothetical protein
MITGVLFLALPISVLGTNFTNAWLESKVSGSGINPMLEHQHHKQCLEARSADQVKK